jgi:hypothetical protein
LITTCLVRKAVAQAAAFLLFARDEFFSMIFVDAEINPSLTMFGKDAI